VDETIGVCFSLEFHSPDGGVIVVRRKMGRVVATGKLAAFPSLVKRQLINCDVDGRQNLFEHIN